MKLASNWTLRNQWLCVTVLPIFLNPTKPALSFDTEALGWLELQVRDLCTDLGDDVSDVWSTKSEIEFRDPLAPPNLLDDVLATGSCTPSWEEKNSMNYMITIKKQNTINIMAGNVLQRRQRLDKCTDTCEKSLENCAKLSWETKASLGVEAKYWTEHWL